MKKTESEEFLICPEHYQGYGVLDLNSIEYGFYMPEEAVDGMAFIWTEIHVSSDSGKIAVDGCVWAAPYQIKIFSIADAMKLPYECLFETSMDDEYGKVIGWNTESEFLYTDSNREVITVNI